jgi:hypothetical protein
MPQALLQHLRLNQKVQGGGKYDMSRFGRGSFSGIQNVLCICKNGLFTGLKAVT